MLLLDIPSVFEDMQGGVSIPYSDSVPASKVYHLQFQQRLQHWPSKRNPFRFRFLKTFMMPDYDLAYMTLILKKIILSTQNSSDIDLVKDIVSANKDTIRYLKFLLFFFYQL